MDLTFVTSFLHGSKTKRNYDEYKQYFDSIVSTGIQIVLFLDKRSYWTFPSNVIVYTVSLDDTWVGKHIPETSCLPEVRSDVDTLEYMQIMNSKTEWLYKASQSNPFNTNWFAWIDFGLVHVFKNPKNTLDVLKQLQTPNYPCLRTSGIWNTCEANIDTVNWRFAGGFLMIHKSKIEELHNRVITKLCDIQPRFTWEVNVWALIERDGFDFGWFESDHNDSMITNI